MDHGQLKIGMANFKFFLIPLKGPFNSPFRALYSKLRWNLYAKEAWDHNYSLVHHRT